MNMKQVWAGAGGFFVVFILISLTNRPHVAAPGEDRQPHKRRTQQASGAETAPAAGGVLPAGFQRGMVYVCSGTSTMGDPASDQALAGVAGTGANWVALNLPLAQASGDAVSVGADPALTPTPAAVAHAVATAHQQHLRVMLRPLVVAADGTTRDSFVPADPKAWMDSYGAALAPYLEVARNSQIELVSLGTGFSGLEATAPWPDLIRTARKGYTGALTYGAAAAPGPSGGGYQSVSFWSQLDYVGVEGFFPLTTQARPTEADLASGWRAAIASVQGWAKQGAGGKPVLFTAVGVPALAGAAADPAHPNQTADPDPELQAASARAFYATMSGQFGIAGAFWYAWEYRGTGGPANPYGVQDQPARAAIQAVFASQK
ncbi:MAG: hypothetical protein JWM80_6412 [Cyanobacteria bacterium RYN_339]|nr:hypothetical protein [Cyanobacteria bacterium RYN_339]